MPLSFLPWLLLTSLVTSSSYATPKVKRLATLPDFTEQILARANGDLLLDQLGHPRLYTLDPTALDSPSLLFEFPNATGLSGMTETSRDVFAVAVGQWNVTTSRADKGTLSIWTLDLHEGEPKAKKVVTIKDSESLNGMASAPHMPNVVFVADSYAGCIYRVDLANGEYTVLITSPDLSPAENGPAFRNAGVNGVRYHRDRLYFTNSLRGLYGRISISRTGELAGHIEILAHVPTLVDDFAIGRDGRAWIALHPSSLILVDQKGQQRVVLNGTEVPDPASAAFGRGEHDKEILYVTVNNLTSTGQGDVGGVIAVDVRSV
jgi:sugar lactone lactonase YvrE